MSESLFGLGGVAWVGLCLLLALATLALLDRWWPVHMETGRNHGIDGLRGFLAFGVFLYHAAIWYFYLRTGRWEVVPSRAFSHLGSSTVALFFMITGYLFFGKLLRSQPGQMDWWRLYVSRFLRIVPLYLLVLLFTLAVIYAIRVLQLDAGLPPHIERTDRVVLVTAGVTWTLKYEWAFYFALPLLAWLAGRRPGLAWGVLSGLVLGLQYRHMVLEVHSLAFLAGMCAAWLSRWAWFMRWAVTPLASGLALLALVMVVGVYNGPYHQAAIVWLALFFALVANGAHLFGLFRQRLTWVFGEITYSIYLLHGPLLFVWFRLVQGFPQASGLSPFMHWANILLLSPLLIALAYASFAWVEKPAFSATPRLTAWLRRRWAR